MKNKLISVLIGIACFIMNLNFVFAITPSAKIELDSYSYTINSLQDVKISGTISKAYGQKLIVKNSNNTPILLNDLPNANGSASTFEFTIKSSRITEGTNTFQIQSSNLMGKVSASNPKTITITYKKQSKQNQVITVSDKSVETGKTINLNATINSGLQLSYFSKNADIATVDGKGVVTGKKEGTVVIEISQNGNDKWNSVKKEVKVTVTKAAVVKKNQTITASNKSVKVGKSISLGAKASSGLKPTYKSSNTKVATVDKNGKVTAKKAGTTKITITQSGNDKYKSASKTISITVSKNSQSIKTNFNTFICYHVGSKFKISTTVSSGLKPTYKSSNTKVGTIDKNGNFVAKNPGKTTITITQKGNNKYSSITKKLTIKVPKIKSRRKALQPWFDALKKQREWSWNAKYKWYPNEHPNIADSKYYGTCITYPSVAAQRCGLIAEGTYIAAHQGEGGNPLIHKSKAAFRSINSRYWTYYTWPGKSVKTLVKQGRILPGDQIGSKRHEFVYAGKNKNGQLIYHHAGHAAGVGGQHGVGSNRAVWNDVDSQNDSDIAILVARINTFDIYTACKDGSITMSNKYMAGQAVKISYKGQKGRKLKSVTVDGKKINIKKYPSSYTFKKLDKNHYVSVIFK